MLQALLDLLWDIPLRPEDSVIFLGDYVDRGENSRKVLDLLLEFQSHFSNTVFLRGNHEQLMLDACDSMATGPVSGDETQDLSPETLLWLQNGGVETLESYMTGNALAPGEDILTRWWEWIPHRHWEFLRATQLEHLTPYYYFVHAGLLPPGSSWEGEAWGLNPRLWIREPFLSSTERYGGRIVVFGHTPQFNGQPLVQYNKIGIDTGAVFGGPLTLVALDPSLPPDSFPQPQFYQIPYACS